MKIVDKEDEIVLVKVAITIHIKIILFHRYEKEYIVIEHFFTCILSKL